MSFESSLYLGFLILVIALVEIVLLIVNYKGRFKYRMYEQTSVWRWFDKQRGILAYLYFPASFIFTVIIAPILLALPGLVALEILVELFDFSIPVELMLSSVLGAIIGALLFNVWMDKFSLKCFKTCYLTCQHNQKCASFRSEVCIIPHVRHNSKALLSLLERKDDR